MYSYSEYIIVDSAIDIAPYNVKIHGTYIGSDGKRCLTDGYKRIVNICIV